MPSMCLSGKDSGAMTYMSCGMTCDDMIMTWFRRYVICALTCFFTPLHDIYDIYLVKSSENSRRVAMTWGKRLGDR